MLGVKESERTRFAYPPREATMTGARDRLLRRRLLMLRWAAETGDEAQRLTRDLDPVHPVTKQLQHIADLCTELRETLGRPAEL
jgi:hypothetical protein